MLALERPTVLRQVVLLAAIAVAFLTRSPARRLVRRLAAALGLHWWIRPAARPRGRCRPRALLADASFLRSRRFSASAHASRAARRRATRSARTGSSGADTTRFDVAKWVVYHLADFELYLAVIPLAVAPIVLARLVRSGRAGSAVDSAFAVALHRDERRPACSWSRRSRARRGATTGSTTATASTSCRSGSSCSSSGSRTACHARSSRPRPGSRWRSSSRRSSPSASSRTRPASTRCRVRSGSGSSPSSPGQARSRAPAFSPLFVVALLVATVLRSAPRRDRARRRSARRASRSTSVLAWERLIDAPEDAVFAGGLERSWIDAAVPEDASVTKLYIDTDCGSALERHALFLTEAFNETVDRAAYIGDSVPDGLPIERVDVGDGRRARALAWETRWSPTTCSRNRESSSRASGSRWGRTPTSSSGEPTGRLPWSARPRTTISRMRACA